MTEAELTNEKDGQVKRIERLIKELNDLRNMGERFSYFHRGQSQTPKRVLKVKFNEVLKSIKAKAKQLEIAKNKLQALQTVVPERRYTEKELYGGF